MNISRIDSNLLMFFNIDLFSKYWQKNIPKEERCSPCHIFWEGAMVASLMWVNGVLQFFAFLVLSITRNSKFILLTIFFININNVLKKSKYQFSVLSQGESVLHIIIDARRNDERYKKKGRANLMTLPFKLIL